MATVDAVRESPLPRIDITPSQLWRYPNARKTMRWVVRALIRSQSGAHQPLTPDALRSVGVARARKSAGRVTIPLVFYINVLCDLRGAGLDPAAHKRQSAGPGADERTRSDRGEDSHKSGSRRRSRHPIAAAVRQVFRRRNGAPTAAPWGMVLDLLPDARWSRIGGPPDGGRREPWRQPEGRRVASSNRPVYTGCAGGRAMRVYRTRLARYLALLPPYVEHDLPEHTWTQDLLPGARPRCSESSGGWNRGPR